MTKYNHSDFVKWNHLLAWHTLETSGLSGEERKVIGAFIGHVKKGKYFSKNNTLLAKAVKIIDTHSQFKSTDLPTVKEQHTKAEKKAIRKGIRQLHNIATKGTAVWAFCNRFLFSVTGKRRTKEHSENRYWHARMTLKIHSKKFSIPYFQENKCSNKSLGCLKGNVGEANIGFLKKNVTTV